MDLRIRVIQTASTQVRLFWKGKEKGWESWELLLKKVGQSSAHGFPMDETVDRDCSDDDVGEGKCVGCWYCDCIDCYAQATGCRV